MDANGLRGFEKKDLHLGFLYNRSKENSLLLGDRTASYGLLCTQTDDYRQVVLQPEEVKGHQTAAYPVLGSDISPVIPYCRTVPLIPQTTSQSQDPQRPSVVKQKAAA